jgi:hypothetical protein
VKRRLDEIMRSISEVLKWSNGMANDMFLHVRVDELRAWEAELKETKTALKEAVEWLRSLAGHDS